MALRRLDARETGLGVDVAWVAAKRALVRGARGREAAHVEVDVADLGDRPGHLLRDRRVRFECEPVGGDRGRGPAGQLTRVRDVSEDAIPGDAGAIRS